MSYQKLTPITAKGTTEPRYLEVRFADIINVKDFGAKGDGETDDTQAVQAACDFAGESRTVFFPDGEYLVSHIEASCCLLGIDDRVSTIKGTGVTGETVLWSGSVGEKTFRNLRVVSGVGQDGINYVGTVRIRMENFTVHLMGDGTAVYVNPPSNLSRVAVLDNFSIANRAHGEEPNNTGIRLKHAIDSRISQGEIMACKHGLVIDYGTYVFYMSDVHIWCGLNHIPSAEWYNSTRCIRVIPDCTFYANNIYLDSAIIGVSARNILKFYANNLLFVDTGSYVNIPGVANGSVFYLAAESEKPSSTSIFIDKGVISGSNLIKNIFHVGLEDFHILRYNHVDIYQKSDFVFRINDYSLPVSWLYTDKKMQVKVYGEKYTPVVFAVSMYNSPFIFYIVDTTSGNYGKIKVRCYNDIVTINVLEGNASDFYYKYNSETGVVAIYSYYDRDSWVDITVVFDGKFNYMYRYDHIYVNQAPFKPDGQNTDSGLTPLGS